MKPFFIALLLALLPIPALLADDPADWIDQPGASPLMAPVEDLGPSRLPAGNATGAPTIPHRIDGHQLTLDSNRCLACHGNEAPAAVEAPPLPQSHKLDRNGEQQDNLAGRRYPCTICHVPQTRTAP